MPTPYRKTPEALARLTPNSIASPRKRDRAPGNRRVPRQPRAGDLRRHRLGRAAVRLGRQVRVGLRLAELHQADRARECQRAEGHVVRHGPHRSALGARRQPPRPRLSPTARATAAACAIASTRPRCASSIATTWSARATAPISTRWRKCDEQRRQDRTRRPRRRLLLGHAGPDPQDGRRRLDARRLQRRRRAERDLPQPRHARRGDRDRLRSRRASAIASLLEFFFQIHDPTTKNRQGNDLGASYRSAIYFTSDEQRTIAEDTIADVEASGLWPGKVVTEARAGGAVLGSRARAPGLPRAVSRTATPATSCGPAGGCRCARARRRRPGARVRASGELRRCRARHALGSISTLAPVARRP